MDNPQFSIVIPTRNRAHLLKSALSSALEQDFESYEILVSNNASEDDTEEVVSQLADQRVRYIKTDRVLSMPDHWEFAIEQARGQYVTFLCDDDARTPDSLKTVARAIAETSSRLLVIGFGTYFSSSWPVEELQNTLHVFENSRSYTEQPSSATLKELAKCQITVNSPRMLLSAIES
ncbi:MAG: glycosyltransferase family 2 protein [Candidatus Melainabacteria bacterium]|nr:glycosyltransferase family 2 protein [Candidatus Melainabacteria bacterium]